MAASFGLEGATLSAPDFGRDGTRSSKIVDLRKLLAERYPQSALLPGTRLRTNIPALDRASAGGLPKNAITEITSSHISAGSASLLHALLHAAYRDHYFLALIDGRDSFDPEQAGNLPLRNLLWIRCHTAMEAVKAA